MVGNVFITARSAGADSVKYNKYLPIVQLGYSCHAHTEMGPSVMIMMIKQVLWLSHLEVGKPRNCIQY